MTETIATSGWVHPAPKKPGLKTWHKVALIVGGGLIALCLLGSFLAAVSPKPASVEQIQPVPSATTEAVAAPPAETVAAPEVPAAATQVKVSGTGNSVVQTGAVLNGGFRVDYSFGSWCGQTVFMKADGSDGAGLMENINDCSGNTDSNLVGSAIVHLSNVTMVEVANTRGGWTLTFTPLG